MDVSQANQVKRGNYKDANAGAKVSAIDCDEKKQDARSNPKRNGRSRGYFSWSDRGA
jgi:hypothetical protein